MKEGNLSKILRWAALTVNLLAAASLVMGYFIGINRGYDQNLQKDMLEGKPYLESQQYQEQASGEVTRILKVVARASRMELNGEYHPDRIIRIRDYLNNKTVYDEMPQSEKENGICYRLGDLYQWSLKGASYGNDVLREAYKPLFYSSIQDYANRCDEEYNVVVSQIIEAMEVLQNDVTAYQQEKKANAYEAVNVRYLLWNLGTGNICTNDLQFLREDVTQEELENYFRSFGSYYIFDSRTTNVQQKNIGEYYSYNTHELLTNAGMNQLGEYQVYMGIDTSFPVHDQIAANGQEYEQRQAELLPYVRKMAISAAIWLLSLLYLLISTRIITRTVNYILEHLNTVLRICLYFVAYEFVQALLALLLSDFKQFHLLMFIFKAFVLLLLVGEAIQRQRLLEGVQAMANGEDVKTIPTDRLFQGNRQMAEAVNKLGEGLRSALEEQMKSERMKADLITNVSHDLKTPLTSIINYVDLMKREKINNEKANEYLAVLDQKSQRLKQLTDDLVEASRASSGNMVLEIDRIDIRELLMQTSGEFEERIRARDLTLICKYPKEPLYVKADGRRLWRIIENLYRNVEKYALPHTRVYMTLENDDEMAVMSMKNISEQPLNISADELMERFTRGDESRTTEGSGLGLSIAKDLTELQQGSFRIYLDGDLFKVTIAIPKALEEEKENSENSGNPGITAEVDENVI